MNETPNQPNGLSDDLGLTLVELLVALTIVGILAAIAVPYFMLTSKQANTASLVSDLRSAVPFIIKTDGSLATEAELLASVKITSGNQLKLEYKEENHTQIACLSGTRAGVGVYHYTTTEATVTEGDCWDKVSTTQPVATVTQPQPSTPAKLTQKEGLEFDVSYQPQTNSLAFCYSVQVTTRQPQVAWEYALDLSAPPFWGADPEKFGSTYNYQKKSKIDNVWVVSGTPGSWNEFVTPSSPKSFGFCVNDVPEPIGQDMHNKTQVTAATGNSNWHACLDVKVTSTSQYPVPWKTEVDLSSYFKSLDGKIPNFQNLTAKNLGGNKYEVTGVTWNKYVAEKSPRLSSATICYSPQGQPW